MYRRIGLLLGGRGAGRGGSRGASRGGGFGGRGGGRGGGNSAYANGTARSSNGSYGSGGGYGGGYGGAPRGGGYGGGGYGGAGNYGAAPHDKSSMAGAKLRNVEWSKPTLAPVVKNLYYEHAAVSRRSQAEIDMFITENEVVLEGSTIPRPIFHFNESTFEEPIVILLCSHYQQPTVIQSISWPVALSGRDMVSIARTGSGKTLGFILPAIIHTLAQPQRARGDGPIVLVLLPTRELAQQVVEVSKEYCRAMNLTLTCLFGGASKGPQASGLKRGVNVCIATSGHLLDFLETSTTNMRCSYLVLDESDRMLDMGFEPQIRKIVGQIRPDRQTLMFSATWPKDVRTLASDFQVDPVFLNVASLELSANHNIHQHVEMIDQFEKQDRPFQLLEHTLKQQECKTIIFTDTKRKADGLTRVMLRKGWPALYNAFTSLCIHGDKNQSERDWVLNEFREGKTPILLGPNLHGQVYHRSSRNGFYNVAFTQRRGIRTFSKPKEELDSKIEELGSKIEELGSKIVELDSKSDSLRKDLEEILGEMAKET